MKHIFRCPDCNTYTLKEVCQKCNTKTIATRPPKFSPEDKYAKYRRTVKKPLLKKEGLL
ncbi:MAG: RNA-protein complex protein Nop10 [Candidatus Woesearchaeota archaeon]|jgi:H/ACA ribonucleoprotein complex subunit 3|nr:RNA-protein complex protein Nop10 [Candidatus Woesearchaeota archaeon]